MNALTPWRDQARTRWKNLSPREQRGLKVLGLLVGLGLFWSLAIAPALHTLRDSEARRAHIAQQQAQMLTLQAQAQALQTRTPLSHQEALRNLQSLSRPPQMQLSAQGERVTVQLKAVPAATLGKWLTQARQQAQALPEQAQLTRSEAKTSATTPAVNAAVNAAVSPSIYPSPPLAPIAAAPQGSSAGPVPSMAAAATLSTSSTAPWASSAGTVVWDGSLVMRLPASNPRP